MKPAIVGRHGAVVEIFGPTGDAPAEVGLTLQHVHRDAAFSEPGGGGEACDPRSDHHHVRNRR